VKRAASLGRVPNAGHIANLDRPELFNALLLDFILHIEKNRQAYSTE
jgi:pimeloyl-ACP methyl ester carboxylesterase